MRDRASVRKIMDEKIRYDLISRQGSLHDYSERTYEEGVFRTLAWKLGYADHPFCEDLEALK